MGKKRQTRSQQMTEKLRKKANRMEGELRMLNRKNDELAVLTGIPDVLQQVTQKDSLEEIASHVCSANVCLAKRPTLRVMSQTKARTKASKRNLLKVPSFRSKHKDRTKASLAKTKRTTTNRRFVSNEAVD